MTIHTVIETKADGKQIFKASTARSGGVRFTAKCDAIRDAQIYRDRGLDTRVASFPNMASAEIVVRALNIAKGFSC